MFAGVPPFRGHNSAAIYKKILNCDQLQLEFVCSREAEDLMRGLLRSNQELRYGSDELEKHPFMLLQVTNLDRALQKCRKQNHLQREFLEGSGDFSFKQLRELYKELNTIPEPLCSPIFCGLAENQQFQRIQELQFDQNITNLSFSGNNLFSVLGNELAICSPTKISETFNPLTNDSNDFARKEGVIYQVKQRCILDVQPVYVNHQQHISVIDNGRKALILNHQLKQKFEICSPYNLPLSQTLLVGDQFVSSTVDGSLLIFDQQTLKLNYQIGSSIQLFQNYEYHLAVLVDEYIKFVDPAFNFRTVSQQQVKLNNLDYCKSIGSTIGVGDSQLYFFQKGVQNMSVRIPFKIHQLVVNENSVYCYNKMGVVSWFDVRAPRVEICKYNQQKKISEKMRSLFRQEETVQGAKYKNGAIFGGLFIDPQLEFAQLHEANCAATYNDLIAFSSTDLITLGQTLE
ncbi:Protein_kinase-like domain superfamily [Hexamita inflata]|uniref:Protein_kinase-like domain superfamily n=1 Tax=Hexamita inflata TaxID=28002 RepID=A0ABP1GIP6_9EUKA